MLNSCPCSITVDFWKNAIFESWHGIDSLNVFFLNPAIL